jgi:transportin-1
MRDCCLSPQLYNKWKMLDDDDRVLCFLMECFTSVVQALGLNFQPWALEVFDRCLRVIQATLVADKAGQEPDKDFAVCSLDLLTGMAEGEPRTET